MDSFQSARPLASNNRTADTRHSYNRWKIHLCICCFDIYLFIFFLGWYYKIWARHDIPISR